MHSQNALMSQSRRDLSGDTHAHGWGVATYEEQEPHLMRQAWAAYHGEHFKRAAAGVFSETVVAHVRRATVGGPSIDNTHPFTYDEWTFAHNGTVPSFSQVRERLLEKTAPDLAAQIRGETDSEHLFYYALTRAREFHLERLEAIVARLVLDVEEILRSAGISKPLGLNVILTDGKHMAGSRHGRSLFSLIREGVYDCEICGFPHIHHDKKTEYRAFIVASEPLTHEEWHEIPDRRIWSISEQRTRLDVSTPEKLLQPN